MTRILVAAAAIALATSGALACPFQKSVSLDTQTVASVDTTTPMSTSEQLIASRKAQGKALVDQSAE